MTSAFRTQNIQARKINHAPFSSSFSFHQTPSQQSFVANDGDEIQTIKKLDDSITVSSFNLAEIVKLGARATGGAILADWIGMGGWREDDASVPKHFGRSLVADRGPDGIPPPAWYHKACLYCLEQSGEGDITLADLTIESRPSMAIEFLNRVRNVIWNGKFFRTSKEPGKGFFGLPPPKAERGDVICILYGCSVPAVLSSRSEIPGSWELVGECFVYGMMDGEAMATDQAWHPQEFEIR
jgi:hypothetical protein